MPHTITPKRTGTDKRIAIAVSQFNETITEALLRGAINTLVAHDVHTDDITVVYVPGAFELPLACQKLADTRRYDAVIALGCVIRGATPHFDYVCAQAASGVASVGLNTSLPVIFGVLTTETIEQAIERSGTKAGNKGNDAAIAALDMISVGAQIDQHAGMALR